MRKIVTTLSFVLIYSVGFAQKRTKTATSKDSIKTEVINVITSYTPDIADADKLRKQPKISLAKKMKKKALSYQIISAPVASTFVPQSGTIKGIDVGKRELIYQNYAAVGFGNYQAPFIETMIHHSNRFENDFGLFASYSGAAGSDKISPWENNFSKLKTEGYYKQTERYLSWEASASFDRNQYHWYGITPESVIPQPTDSQQTYSTIGVSGKIELKDSPFVFGQFKASLFSDVFQSKEFAASLLARFQLSLDRLFRSKNDLIVDTSIDYLNGEFIQGYQNTTPVTHRFFTVGVQPSYRFSIQDLTVKLGTQLYFNTDTANNNNQFFIYPDLELEYPILKDVITLTIGANGGLEANSYQRIVQNNPFVSPTLYSTQTNTKYAFFGRFSGQLTTNTSYTLQASYQDQEDKPLFLRNNSKFGGSASILGYEYGNSFTLIYDHVKTLSITGEVSVDLSKHLSIHALGEFKHFTLTQQPEAWNLPTIQGRIHANYKQEKWYASTQLFFVGERKDQSFDANSTVLTNASYLDLNVNGGYHFNDKWTAFARLNNVLNAQYQQFTNFNVLGFQALAGISYKFDF